MEPPPPDHPDWGALYLQHRAKMWAVARKILAGRGWEEAEDIVMDAMKSLLTSPPSNVRNWEAVMVRAVKFRALDHLQTAGVRHAADQEAPDVADPFTDVADDVADAIDRRRDAEIVGQEFRKLKDRQQQVLSMRFIEHKRVSEIGTQLGISDARVSQLVAEALTTLRQAISERGVTK